MNYYENEMNKINVESEVVSVVFSDYEGNSTKRFNLNVESIEVLERKLKAIKKVLQDDVLKVGDTVLWKGGWGQDAEKEVIVKRIEVDCVDKNGDEVDSVEWSKVKDRTLVVDLDNGKWSYGENIRKK